MRVMLAGTSEESLMQAAYPALATAGFDVVAVVESADRLARVAAALGAEGVAVVEADLYATPGEAVAALGALPTRVAVILPPVWAGERQRFAALSNLIAGFTAPIPWTRVASELKQRPVVAGRPVDGRLVDGGPAEGELVTGGAVTGDRQRAMSDEQPLPSYQPPNLPITSLPAPNLPVTVPRRLVAVWSGPMGGSGRTALALLLGLRVAERAMDTPLLLALAEPAVSAMLHLSRVPNVTTFFASGDLSAVLQGVAIPTADGHRSLRVALGPARAREGAVEREKIAGLVEAARAAFGLVLADLPVQVPGGNPWTLEPLRQANDVLLVVPPTGMGVVAAVEALATLRDLEAAGRVYLALNRRTAASGMPVQEFVASVTAVWGSCPPVAAVVPFVAGLPGALDGGELPEDRRLMEAVDRLAEAVLGLPRPVEDRRRTTGDGRRTTDDRRQTADDRPSSERPRRRLISIEVTG